MTTAPLMIGKLAQQTGTKVTTIRFYETIGLLSVPPRTESGRRTYGVGDVQRLRFVRNGRRLGFSIEEIRSLIGLTENPSHDCSAASAIASRHLEDVENRLAQLALLRDELAVLSQSCTNDQIANCRIIQAIAETHAPGAQ
ncbi:MerR family transcriptional regulator [Sphingomonas faeni]|uniref:MerR family transcriptional regulator n=1 Tax=Sphingomonas faeni TaxID=185950 RepID=UPI003353A772